MNIKNFIHRLLVKLHLRQDYGFTQLMYRGKPVIQWDDMPDNSVGFINEKTARVRILTWKGTKSTVGKEMTFKQFYAWIDRNKKGKKYDVSQLWKTKSHKA